jgi:peptidoglycan/LPS O-acetylase OafA/YrhL
VFVEATMLVAGIAFYVRTTRARDRVGVVGFWSLVGFLALVNAATISGPTPPGPSAVAWSAQAMWLIVLCAFWVDRHRQSQVPGWRPAQTGGASVRRRSLE